MVAYKLGDNFSISRAHEFIMEPVIRGRFGLDEFNVKTLYRAVERLGRNREKIVDGREGFFCLTSNLDLNPYAIRKMYRDKDCVEKLFSSMKSDIGIRPIRAWTDDARLWGAADRFSRSGADRDDTSSGEAS